MSEPCCVRQYCCIYVLYLEYNHFNKLTPNLRVCLEFLSVNIKKTKQRFLFCQEVFQQFCSQSDVIFFQGLFQTGQDVFDLANLFFNFVNIFLHSFPLLAQGHSPDNEEITKTNKTKHNNNKNNKKIIRKDCNKKLCLK